MAPTFEAVLRSWPFDPWIVVPLLLTAAVYVRGWCHWRERTRRFGPRQLHSFMGGIAVLLLALCSPIDPFAGLLLQVHMLQHLLLMMVAPPLLWQGAPLLPLLRGLPAPIRRHGIAPLLRSPPLRALFEWLTRPAVAWVSFVATTWVWHAPHLYGLALRSDGWHALQHTSFFLGGLLFWYPVVRPYPSRPGFSRWLLLPYLLFADVQNTALAALFTFSNRVLYAHYAVVPMMADMSALEDQVAAGLLMWVPGSLVFLVPLVCIARGLLYGKSEGEAACGASSPRGRRTSASPSPSSLVARPDRHKRGE
jgi:cytochrome c oxidase assembly factor CtaG